MPATTQGKKKALADLAKRRKKNAKATKVDNGALYAGSPMYYYCISCDGLAQVLPELHNERPKQLCDECQALKDLGWLE
jgi:hypothetical protein